MSSPPRPGDGGAPSEGSQRRVQWQSSHRTAREEHATAPTPTPSGIFELFCRYALTFYIGADLSNLSGCIR